MRHVLTCVAVLLVSMITVAGNIPTDGLIAHYPFDGDWSEATGNGPTINKVSPTIDGPAPVKDRDSTENGAYYFSGTWTYLMGNGAQLPSSGNFSVTFWTRYSACCSKALITWGGTDVGSVFSIMKVPGILSGSSAIAVTNGTDTVRHEYRPVDRYDYWMHYAITVQGSKIKIYTDYDGEADEGFWEDIVSEGTIDWNISGSHLVVGGGRVYGERLCPECGFLCHEPWIGGIDDLAIYDKTLTAEEVKQSFTGLTTATGTQFSLKPRGKAHTITGIYSLRGRKTDASKTQIRVLVGDIVKKQLRF